MRRGEKYTGRVVKVVALDPGITTGLAIGNIMVDWGLMLIDTGQAKYNHKELYDGLVRQRPQHLVCERFEFRKKSREGLILYSRELIGIANLYSQQFGISLTMQQPSEALGGFWTDKQLKKDKLYKVTTGGHANDALRHLLQWYVFGAGFKYNKAGYEKGW
jgi:hypothetical protein